MKNKWWKRLFDVVLILVLIVTVYYSFNYIKTNYEKHQVSNDIKSEISVLENTTDKEKTLEYYKDYYSNDNIVGTLKIDNTNINTLLVQTTDNEYYLNHSVKNEYDIIGSIYVDYRTSLNAKQINIYGHNSNVYDVMFKELEKYLDKDFYLKHKYVELWDGDKTNIYEIFSVQIVTKDYEHIDVNSSNWDKHISILNSSVYETETMANGNDDILVIQTCFYNPADSLLIINAKKI